MGGIGSGASLLFTGDTILWVFVGIVAGFFLGVIPGLSGPNAVAILLPLSMFLSTLDSLVLMTGVYAGCAFGASIPGILLNLPGNVEAAAATQDGYPLTLRGRAGLAIGISRMASVLGGCFSAIVALLVIGPISDFSLKFGPRELFIVSLIGMILISSLLGRPRWKGFVAAALGLMLGTVGGSPVTAEPRFIGGYTQLFEGVPFVPVVIGIFAVPQMLELIYNRVPLEAVRRGRRNTPKRASVVSDLREGIVITLKHWACVLRSSVLGVLLGIMPGFGAAAGNFIAYGLAKKTSKQPEQFGNGAPEGIIGPETCDNAITSASLIPAMTLGIPGGSTAAVVLGALALHGITPGPSVMTTHGSEVYAVLLSMLIGSILILPLGIICAGPLSQVTRVPSRVLVPIVFLLCVIGMYSVQSSWFDVEIGLAFGIAGHFMRRAGYPIMPLVVGLILGPLMESNLMRSLSLGNNEASYFFESKIALTLWALLIAFGLLSVLGAVRRRPARPVESADASARVPTSAAR